MFTMAPFFTPVSTSFWAFSLVSLVSLPTSTLANPALLLGLPFLSIQSLWEAAPRQERVEYLKKVCSNPVLDSQAV